MALASGADVDIGGYEFMLATDGDDDGYQWITENLYGDSGEIEGTEGKKAANRNILFWGYDDFRRGDGLRYWDPDQKDRWWTGNTNPRIPGAITSPPTRSQSSTITTGVTPTGGFFSSGLGRAWYLTGDQGYHSGDGATWTENTDIAVDLPASYQITGACNDGTYVYFAASDGTNRGIWRVTSNTTSVPFVTAHAGTAYQAIAVRDQFLYAWTGGALIRYRHTQTPPLTHETRNVVYSPRGIPSASIFSAMVSGEGNLYFSRALDGDSVIFEYKLDPATGKLAGRTMWTMANGFTAKKLAVQAGVLLVLGDYLGKVGLWGYSKVNQQPLFLGYVGEADNATNVRFIAPSYGAQVILGVDDGTTSYVYVYDLEEDSFSKLDERTIAADGTLMDGFTFKNRRLAAAFSTTSTKINRWILDTDTPAGAWTWDSAAHDLDYPQDEKILLGFHVILDPTIIDSTVRVWYQIDESGTWVNTGVDATAAAKHSYITVSSAASTVKFRTLRIRMVGASGARCFSVTSRSYINSKQEIWKLNLDLRNEPGTTRRPSDRSVIASKLKDNLHVLVYAGDVVTFKDGTRRRRKSSEVGTGYSSHTVLVEFPKNSVDSGKEGTAEVILRSVAPSA